MPSPRRVIEAVIVIVISVIIAVTYLTDARPWRFHHPTLVPVTHHSSIAPPHM
jgi:hypothetical protein